jgi:hypothetical protein
VLAGITCVGHSTNDILVDCDRAACDFIHVTKFLVPYREDPAEYRGLMALNPGIKDDGFISAAMLFQALALPNVPPTDRDFVTVEHRVLARAWFLKHPQVICGLERMGYDQLQLALDIGWSGTIPDALRAESAREMNYDKCVANLKLNRNF